MEYAIKPKIDWNGPIQVAIVAGIILGANLPFFFLHRSEMKEWKAEHEQTIKEMRNENNKFWETWANETKEFHGRLSKLEEKTEYLTVKK